MCIEPLDPDIHPPRIMCIVNGKIPDKSDNIYNTVEVKTQTVKKYESKRSEGFNKKSSKAEFIKFKNVCES